MYEHAEQHVSTSGTMAHSQSIKYNKMLKFIVLIRRSLSLIFDKISMIEHSKLK